MPDSAEVVGDELIVVHNQQTVRLSLAVPFERLDVWLAMEVDMPWRKFHNAMRDDVMPESAREQILEIEPRDSVFAVELVRGWANALNDRLGKSLSLPLFGEESVPPSPPTSGSGTDSTPTEPEPPAQPRRSRSTRKPS